MLTVCTIFHVLNTGKAFTRIYTYFMYGPWKLLPQDTLLRVLCTLRMRVCVDQEVGEGAVLKWLWYLLCNATARYF